MKLRRKISLKKKRKDLHWVKKKINNILDEKLKVAEEKLEASDIKITTLSALNDSLESQLQHKSNKDFILINFHSFDKYD
jgi:hypothetical protein